MKTHANDLGGVTMLAMRSSFGPFEFDHDALELWREGQLAELQPQPARLLAWMLKHPGVLVTREELRRALWDAETYVDFERGLNYCVSQVRAALGDRVDEPRYLETLRGRGYRFLAEPMPARKLAPRQPPDRPKLVWAWAVGVVVLVVLLGVWRRFDVNQRQEAVAIAVEMFAADTPDAGAALPALQTTIVACLSNVTTRPVKASDPAAPSAARWRLSGRAAVEKGVWHVTVTLTDSRTQAVRWSAVLAVPDGSAIWAQTDLAGRIAAAVAQSLDSRSG